MQRREFLAAAVAFAGSFAFTAQTLAADKAHAAALGEGQGILFDTDDNVVYTVNNDGGIDALDLKTGKARWTMEANEKRFYWPLAVVGDRLITRARIRDIVRNETRIAIAVLSTKDGKETKVTDTLPFPLYLELPWFQPQREGVNVYRERLKSGFWTATVQEKVDGDRLTLEWKAIKTVGKETTFAAFEETQTQAASGTIVVDLAKGTATAKDVNEKADLPKTIDAVKSRADRKEATVNKVIFRIDERADAPLRFKFQRVLKAIDPENKEKVLWEHAIRGVPIPR